MPILAEAGSVPSHEGLGADIRAPNGLRVNSPRHTAGNRRRNISFAIGIVSMAMSLSVAFARWAFGTGRSHHDRHGRTDMRRGSSVQSDGIALTMSLSSASGIFPTCLDRPKNITMMLARTYR